jgi:hypothetical protein
MLARILLIISVFIGCQNMEPRKRNSEVCIDDISYIISRESGSLMDGMNITSDSFVILCFCFGESSNFDKIRCRFTFGPWLDKRKGDFTGKYRYCAIKIWDGNNREVDTFDYNSPCDIEIYENNNKVHVKGRVAGNKIVYKKVSWDVDLNIQFEKNTWIRDYP